MTENTLSEVLRFRRSHLEIEGVLLSEVLRYRQSRLEGDGIGRLEVGGLYYAILSDYAQCDAMNFLRPDFQHWRQEADTWYQKWMTYMEAGRIR